MHDIPRGVQRSGYAPRVPPVDHARIVELYLQKKDHHEIRAITGASRSTIYNVLDKAGVRPDRKGGLRTRLEPEDATILWLQKRNAELERQLAILQERLRIVRDTLFD